MAAKSGADIVSEFLSQNPHLVKWVDSLKEYCETGHQWLARREFILRNLELFPTIQPGTSSHNLDRLLSLSMVWANMVFLGCRYPHPVMSKINEMAEGIVVTDVLERKTRDELMGKTKRPADSALHSDLQQKKTKPNESDVKAHARSVVHPAVSPKINLPPGAAAEHQAFFNRLYKTVAWKLVSAGGFGPNLEHFEILRSCVESNKSTLSCVFVPLKDIPDLPSGRTQKEGQVCELRCHTVYMGTGYGRDEFSAKAMASKEALKVFQGQKVTVKICRRRFRGRDVDDLVLLDEQSRSQVFPPALSHPFQEGQ